MKEFKYENAVVRITIPTKEQKENIVRATERFVKRIAKEGYFENYAKTRVIKK